LGEGGNPVCQAHAKGKREKEDQSGSKANEEKRRGDNPSAPQVKGLEWKGEGGRRIDAGAQLGGTSPMNLA